MDASSLYQKKLVSKEQYRALCVGQYGSSYFPDKRSQEESLRELLEQHYDPLYRRSQEHNFTGKQHAATFAADDLSPTGIARLAAAIVQSRIAQIA